MQKPKKRLKDRRRTSKKKRKMVSLCRQISGKPRSKKRRPHVNWKPRDRPWPGKSNKIKS